MKKPKEMKNVKRCSKWTRLSAVLLVLLAVQTLAMGQKHMEYLNRGLVAVSQTDQVFLSWRIFATDTASVEFNLYRNDELVNSEPIIALSNYTDSAGVANSIYYLETITNDTVKQLSTPVSPWQNNYLTLPLETPEGYTPNDVSIGDLDGDGTYDLVVKMEGNTKDNSQSGITDPVYLQAYTLNGTFLWSINLGINIRGGAHYTQFMVYDLDSDGRAEVACKTAPGTRDASGHFLSDGPAADDDDGADFRNGSGYILDGPEYLTVFDGLTGMEINTVDYIPHRSDPYSLSTWGDTYGNRVDRFLACVAYFDSIPSLVMCRGYYDRTALTAWDFKDGKLTQRWAYDSQDDLSVNREYEGQGAHSIAVGDVDMDGKDEIMYGAMAFDDDGTPLYNTKFQHGDATHLSDLVPSSPGQEFFMPHESAGSTSGGVTIPGVSLRNAATGEIIWSKASTGDIGRGMCADISAEHPGYEYWASSGLGVYSSSGQTISSSRPPINFAVWWDGDLLREMLDKNVISKWNQGSQLVASGCTSNNGTKSTPALSGDILGDWREEVIWRTNDNQSLRIYTTTKPTEYGIYTLVQDPQYRQALAWQNVAYNQPPHPSFFLGHGMETPPVPFIKVLDPSDSPVLQILSPRNGEEYYLGPDLDVILVAAGINDTNQVVVLYDHDTTYLDSLLAPPYATSISGLGSGEHRFTAAAYNKAGELFWSNPVTFTIDEGFPHIRITSPEDNSIFGPGESLSVIVDAFDTDGSIDSVAIYMDGEVQVVLTAAPYELTIDHPDLGVHEISATAWDNGQNSVDATPIFVEVGAVMVLQENELGFCGFYKGGGTIDSNHEGHTGDGFANSENIPGVQLIWALDLPEDGSYNFAWSYAASSARPGSLYVNDILIGEVDFKNTGAWTTWETASLGAENLTAGLTKITLEAANESGLPNIDYLKVISLSAEAGATRADCDLLDLGTALAKEKLNGMDQISIYPVPAKESLFISCEQQNAVIDGLQIYRIDGSLVQQQIGQVPGAKTSVDVSGLDDGIYLLRVNTSHEVYTRKFNVLK